MTVCIAAMFNWIYGPNDIGKAIITVSDRQITADDVEYEPSQLKVGFFSPRTLILIAGDYPTHSEAILRTHRQLAATGENDPSVIAELYASSIREIKSRHAANLYLAPVGLNRDSFLSRQHELDPDFIDRLTSQLQRYEGEQTEALIVGCDPHAAHIYLVDTNSQVTCHNDVGFAAIGIGAWHAKSTLMQARYSSTRQYAAAIALTYGAKKRAEIAPGVGTATDFYLVTRTGWAPVLPDLIKKTADIYDHYNKRQGELVIEAIGQLQKYIDEMRAKLDAQKGTDNED